MKVLFDVAHPAHVHLFRNLIARLRREGGEALVATREKDVTVGLCEAYGIPQAVLSSSGGGLARGAWELAQRTVRLLSLARRMRPDALVGPSMSIGPVGRLIGRPSFVFCEDDAQVVPLFARLAYPASHYVVTPACLAHERHGRKHITYPGYHELAYLHPDHFDPDPEAGRALGLGPGEPYFILRLVALRGHHDARARGMSAELARRIVAALSARGRVLITSEAELAADLEPYRLRIPPQKLHDLLAFASLYVGDSQTLSAEAAVLGVPGLRCNSFVGRISYLEELESRYGLTKGFAPQRGEALLATLLEWLADLPAVKRQMQSRRRRMLQECVNVAEWQWRMLHERVREAA